MFFYSVRLRICSGKQPILLAFGQNAGGSCSLCVLKNLDFSTLKAAYAAEQPVIAISLYKGMLAKLTEELLLLRKEIITPSVAACRDAFLHREAEIVESAVERAISHLLFC